MADVLGRAGPSCRNSRAQPESMLGIPERRENLAARSVGCNEQSRSP